MGLLLGLAALAPAVSFATDLTAEQILARVSQTYRGLTSFHFVERETVTAEQTSVDRRPEAPTLPFSDDLPSHDSETDLAVSSPGKIRVVVRSGRGKILVVSNGRNTWAYIPDLEEYIEAAAAPLLDELWAHGTYPIYSASGVVAGYRSLSRVAVHARLRGEETLSLGGRKARCYVVDIPGYGWDRLWVDEQRFIVLQDRSSDEEVYVTWRLAGADLGPISDKVFEFAVPSGARRVDSFSRPAGRLQRDEEKLAVLLIGWEKWSNGGEGVIYPYEGTKGRDFTLGSLGGGNVRLQSLRGKIVVLDFWASWCKPCQEELAAMQKLHDELASQGVVFLGIDDESPETVKSFVQAGGYTFPMLLDTEQAIPQLYGVRLVPTTVVIDRKGKIAAHYVGAGGEAGLRRALQSAGLNTTP